MDPTTTEKESEMQVNLIHYTGQGTVDEKYYAARLLAFTKNTRLSMNPEGLSKFALMGEAELLEELRYMAGTIPSSWEFIDVVFSVNNISRATAQQMTRTRTASFAMQSQRVTDMSKATWDSKPGRYFDDIMQSGVNDYGSLVENGMALEDARDVLPIGVHCNLIAKYNFRSFVDLVRSRESLRVQGPYVSIVREMKAAVINVWPWSKVFFEPKDKKAIEIIEFVASALNAKSGGAISGHARDLAKAADLLKK